MSAALIRLIINGQSGNQGQKRVSMFVCMGGEGGDKDLVVAVIPRPLKSALSNWYPSGLVFRPAPLTRSAFSHYWRQTKIKRFRILLREIVTGAHNKTECVGFPQPPRRSFSLDQPRSLLDVQDSQRSRAWAYRSSPGVVNVTVRIAGPGQFRSIRSLRGGVFVFEKGEGEG
ncbi:hypothetical protein ElyMa_002457500 [Elysia marginata]|uniref:Uncharacterized protein n=1 Tax=Elysia marginata TaxID=1093978 RepID=A0AAV4GK24_9GAST|nr:hypothetical protein ElyMa_002457500 [Elysia marginata]